MWFLFSETALVLLCTQSAEELCYQLSDHLTPSSNLKYVASSQENGYRPGGVCLALEYSWLFGSESSIEKDC